MEKVIARKGDFTVVRMENKRKIGGKVYNTLRHEFRLHNECYRGFSGTPESEVLEIFEHEHMKEGYHGQE